MHEVRCTNEECAAVTTVTSGDVDIHDALDAAGCKCCTQPHNHGRAARETGVPCRPVTIILSGASAGVS
jgi:hypothetical protein